MSRIFCTFICAVVVFAGRLVSHAQYYTIGPGGPSGYAPDTVFTPGGPPPGPAPGGATPTLVGPPPPYPFVGPGAYVIDGLASGADAGNNYYFSVAPGAVGLPGSPVALQVTVGSGPSKMFGGAVVGPLPPEVAGDIFHKPSAALPGAVPTFGILALATPSVVVPPAIFTDEFALGLNVGPIVPDNLNALTYRAPSGAFGFYYSLAAGGLGASGVAAADILNITGIWAPALALSLNLFGGPGSDDIDALLVQDLGILGVYEPGIDFVAFSLTPGSATLGAPGPGYAFGGGDLLVPDGADADPFPDIFIPGASFGLAPGDNLDAIDVVPEPATGALLLLAGSCFVFGRRWQNRRS